MLKGKKKPQKMQVLKSVLILFTVFGLFSTKTSSEFAYFNLTVKYAYALVLLLR